MSKSLARITGGEARVISVWQYSLQMNGLTWSCKVSLPQHNPAKFVGDIHGMIGRNPNEDAVR